MLDILNNWFQNGNQQSQQQMPNLRQSWLNQFLQQQPAQQAPEQQMPMQNPQMPQNGLAPNFRQQLYLQNLMNQKSQGFGSPYSSSFNPNNLPPGAGQNLNPPVRGEVPAPSLAPQQAAPAQPMGMGYMSPNQVKDYIASAPKGSQLSIDNYRNYYDTTGYAKKYAFSPLGIMPGGWGFNNNTGYYTKL